VEAVAQSRALTIEEVDLPEITLSGWLADVVTGFMAGYGLAQLTCSATSYC
jgi:hypothetical protein